MSKQQKIWLLVLVMVVATIIGFTVFADDIVQSIDVAVNTVNLKVNGKTASADNFVYQGRTYVQLRNISELLGKNVGWDSATNTVTINDSSTETSVIEQPNGNGSYQGEYVKSGQGKYIWKDGNVYEGQWDSDLISGTGTLIYQNVGKYTGEYQDNKRNGQGTFTWDNGDTYQGSWKNDMMNGKGVYNFKNGDVYDGNWTDNTMNGQGTYTFKDGKKLQGTWKDNKFIY